MMFFTIAPPSALEIESKVSYENRTKLLTVRTLNFRHDNPGGLPPVFQDSGSSDLGYPRLNHRLLRIAESSALRGEVEMPASPCGKNCSYRIEFYLPGYHCQDMPFSETPFGSDDVLRTKREEEDVEGTRTIYTAQAIQGNLWVAFSYLKPGIRDYINITEGEGPAWNADEPDKVTDDDFVFTSFVCSDWNTSYQATLFFEGDGASVQVNTRTLVNQVNYTEDIIGPYIDHHMAIQGFIASWLQGNITLEVGGIGNVPKIPESLRLYSTKLVNTSEPFGDDETEYFYPVLWLRDAVQDLHRNVSLSMLSAQPFFYFVEQLSGHPCTVIESVPVYVYKKVLLLAIYAPAAALSLGMHLCGLAVVRMNGVFHGHKFSTILATSRNPDLDDLVRGDSLGREKTVSGLNKISLGFGRIDGGRNGGLPARFGFGRDFEDIQKYRPYN